MINKHLTLIVALTLALFVPLPMLAQTLTARVAPNTPFTIGWDHDVPTGDRFRWWCDGQIVKNFAPSDLTVGQPDLTKGLWPYEATVPGLPAGKHTCWITAYVEGIEQEGKSPVLTVPSGVSDPQNLRLIIKLDLIAK